MSNFLQLMHLKIKKILCQITKGGCAVVVSFLRYRVANNFFTLSVIYEITDTKWDQFHGPLCKESVYHMLRKHPEQIVCACFLQYKLSKVSSLSMSSYTIITFVQYLSTNSFDQM